MDAGIFKKGDIKDKYIFEKTLGQYHLPLTVSFTFFV